jgi:glycosyltransferase involved in cell wall biosynthesis
LTVPQLTVLIPVHNEAPNVQPVFSRLRAVLESQRIDWQAVFLNNASADSTLSNILELRKADPRVKVITLSRDFGYQASLVAGLTTVESDLYAIIDGDGEDPPELLPEFLSRIHEGADLAYGIRSHRHEAWWITRCRALFYYLNRCIADSEIVLWMGEFAMFSRVVRDAILAPHTISPFLRSEMAFVGLRRVGVPYVRGQRTSGRSHYNLYRMTKFAISGFLASSTFPLRLILYVASFLGVALPIGGMLLKWRPFDYLLSIAVALFYFILLCGSTLGLYLARTYKSVVNRPLFIVDPKGTHLK